MFWEIFYSLCEKNGLKPFQVVQQVGIAAGSITKWKNGSVPSGASLQKLSSFFGVTTDYLINGVEQPTSPGNSQPLNQDNVYLAPLYESVSAGFGAYAAENAVDRVPIYVAKPSEAADTICIRVRGDSMSPIISDGDIVQVRKQDSVISGSVAVVMIEDEGYVKSVFYEEGKWLELRSENPNYPVMRFEGSALRRVRVVGFVTKVVKNVNAHVDAVPDDSKQRLDALMDSMDEQQLRQFLALAESVIQSKK